MRTCVFCGEAGVTREHLLPNWLNGVIRDELGFTVSQRDDSHEVVRSWQKVRLDDVGRFVCRECNTGWLSELESQSMVLITRLLQGRRTLLSGPRQHLVATWAYKTLLLKSIGSLAKVPPEHFRSFFVEHHPGGGSNLRIACYGGQRWTSLFEGRHLGVAVPTYSPDLVPAYLLTLSLGRLIMQVVAPKSSGQMMFPHEDRRVFVNVWPPTRRVRLWPPKWSIGDEGITLLRRLELPDLERE